MHLTNRVTLITGGKRIGVTVAEEVARRGSDVVLCYAQSIREAEEAAAKVRAVGQRAVILQADLSAPDACRVMVGKAVDALGGVDILINMASRYVQKPFDQLTPADWSAALDVDLRAAFLCSHAVVPSMRARGGGRIINFSDWTAKSGRPRYLGFVPYYVAKAGVIALTEALALELAADQILVNAIAPGPILAPPSTTDEEHQAVMKATPLGRWGGADQIAKAILGLIDSDFITGETIRVDGGRHIK